MEELDRLAARSYKTYKARLVAADRLRDRQRAWNTNLLALSVATTIASIGLLSDAQMYGEAGPTVLVCVSVGSLVASLAVSGLNYGARSRDMFMNYRALQRLSVEAEALQDERDPDPQEVRQLGERYESLLDDSENHTAADHKTALASADISLWVKRRSVALTLVPYAALVVPIAVLLPFISWVVR